MLQTEYSCKLPYCLLHQAWFEAVLSPKSFQAVHESYCAPLQVLFYSVMGEAPAEGARSSERKLDDLQLNAKRMLGKATKEELLVSILVFLAVRRKQ